MIFLLCFVQADIPAGAKAKTKKVGFNQDVDGQVEEGSFVHFQFDHSEIRLEVVRISPCIQPNDGVTVVNF